MRQDTDPSRLITEFTADGESPRTVAAHLDILGLRRPDGSCYSPDDIATLLAKARGEHTEDER